MSYTPTYINLHKDGILEERIDMLDAMLGSCTVCPHNCGVNRIKGETGICGASAELEISNASPHFGEESPLVGRYGSGTIFLTHCNLKCVFCQNYDISHFGNGRIISSEELSDVMIQLQSLGCHNINFVTPTHYTPQIVSALPKAIEMGLRVKLVYNCGGYESVETLRLLDGIIDIYMPDAKFSKSETASKYTKAKDYTEILQDALREMHKQVGDLVTNSLGIAERGMLIRHLVIPEALAGTRDTIKFIVDELSTNSFVNIMAQYRPCHLSYRYNELNRKISRTEFSDALQTAKDAGIKGKGIGNRE